MISCADDNLRWHETCVRSVKGIECRESISCSSFLAPPGMDVGGAEEQCHARHFAAAPFTCHLRSFLLPPPRPTFILSYNVNRFRHFPFFPHSHSNTLFCSPRRLICSCLRESSAATLTRLRFVVSANDRTDERSSAERANKKTDSLFIFQYHLLPIHNKLRAEITFRRSVISRVRSG